MDFLSDEMTCANEEETCSGRRAGMMIGFTFKSFWQVECLLLEDNKIAFTLKYFFTVGSLFNAEGYAHDYACGAVRILGKDVNACFTFEVETLLDTERLDEVK